MDEAVSLQRDEIRRNSVVTEDQLAQIKIVGKAKELKDQVIKLTEENKKLQESINNRGTEETQSLASMSIASERSNLADLENDELKAKLTKLQSDKDTYTRKLKAALLSRKELISSEKILKAHNEDLRKDLDERRKIISQKEKLEQEHLDRIEILNKNVENLTKANADSSANATRSNDGLVDQLGALKQQLTEKEIDVQTVQRALDQQEADNVRLQGEINSLQSENDTLGKLSTHTSALKLYLCSDSCQKDLTEMVKKLEDEKMTLETALSEKSELLSNLENQADTGNEQLLAVQEEADELRTKASMTEELQSLNYDLKKAAEKAEAELLVATAELKETQNAKTLFEEELKHATELSSLLGQEKQSLQEEVGILQSRTKELQESLVQAGKAIDDSIHEKDEIERVFQEKLRENEMKLEKERQQFENDMSNTRQQTELLQQSSEAALFKVFSSFSNQVNARF